jgi:hypothetical protein
MVDCYVVRRTRPLLLGLIVTIAGGAHAQQRHFVVGAKVKILAADSVDQNRVPVGARREFIGVVASPDGDTLILRDDDGPKQRKIATARITEAHEWAGSETHMTTGALVGGGVGVALGLLAIHSGSCSGDCDGILAKIAEREAAGLVVAFLGGVGVVVGTLIGAMPDDQWRPMPNARVGIVPVRRGVGVNLSVQW